MSAVTSWSENTDLLVAQLKVGDRWEKWLAKAIMKAGHPCTTQELRVRQHIGEADEFGDQVDIEVYGKVIEVKSRNLSFSMDPGSFPFDDIIVDTVDGWNKKTRKPDAYVCISQVTRGIICLPGRTRPDWQTVRMRDHVRHITDDFFTCHRDLWRHGRALLRSLFWTKRLSSM